MFTFPEILKDFSKFFWNSSLFLSLFYIRKNKYSSSIYMCNINWWVRHPVGSSIHSSASSSAPSSFASTKSSAAAAAAGGVAFFGDFGAGIFGAGTSFGFSSSCTPPAITSAR